MSNELGKRMKKYEATFDTTLPPNSYTFIRVDGKAFHSYTRKRGFEPFSLKFHNAMRWAAKATAKEMSGFRLAYVQSDEATFMLTDTEKHETEPWMGGRVNKLNSITASMFTAYFNKLAGGDPFTPPAFFDARTFTVPEADAPNVFVWRQKDWYRNSVQMLGQSNFSHKQLLNKSLPDIHELLKEKEIFWDNLEDWAKFGTFIFRDYTISSKWLDYNDVKSGER